MSLFDDDNDLTVKQFIKKLWLDVRLIIFFGLIAFSILWGIFSVMDLLGV